MLGIIDTTQTIFSNLRKSTDSPTYGICANDDRMQLLEAMQIKSNGNYLGVLENPTSYSINFDVFYNRINKSIII